jgi:hypothetical protein
MAGLKQRDYREGWRLVCEMAGAAGDARAFARLGTEQLPRLVASEITTLSVCDLARNTRSVTSSPGASISKADREAFDRYFAEHPLVRYHSATRGAGSHRISDSLPTDAFRETPLYNDYYRRIGIDHVIAVPLYVDRGLLVSFVLNRKGRDFSDREKALLDLVREPLAALYRHALSRERALQSLPVTDRQIAEILGMSPRTVQKHLQHIYEKLGVETRTAAVMRALGSSAGAGTR